jgi:ATP-binding cassette subfamily B protein
LTLKQFKLLFKGSYLWCIIPIIATFLDVGFQMIPPMIIKTTLDSVLSTDPLSAPAPMVWIIEKIGGTQAIAQHLWYCTIAIAIIAIINAVLFFVRKRVTATAAEGMALRLKDRLYDHLQKLPYEYHIKAKTGDLIQRCTSDVETIRRFVNVVVMDISRAIFLMIFSSIVMFSVNVQYSIISVCSIPILVIASYFYSKRIHRLFKKIDEKEGELSTVLQENVSGIRVVRAFGRQKLELQKFEKKNTEYRDMTKKFGNQLAIYWGVGNFLCYAQILLTLIAGVVMSRTNPEITVGTIIMFQTYVQLIVWPMRQFGRQLSEFSRMRVAVSRIFEILNEPEESDTPGAEEHDLRGDIVFKNVSFAYSGQSEKILQKMSFAIKNGETIAILGATASGKSTLMHILLRLYDYQSGSIKINGVELKNISKKYLRKKIGIVLQEPFLFSKTIRENIRMANHAATDAEIEGAAKTAAVHDDINDFEKGYETIVGEKGVTLSGGQRQRVAIARTIIKESDILIFDDSLSAVDTETDAQIRNALAERETKATTFIISQRITTLMKADRIFVIEGGKISAIGTHAELIAKEGLYSRVWAIQAMLADQLEDELPSDNLKGGKTNGF